MRIVSSVFLTIVLALPGAGAEAATTPAGAWSDPSRWVVEQMPGGTVVAKDGRLVIDDANGCTVWWRQELTAPVTISYDATVISAGGAHDRVSDLNCFWMAQEPNSSAAPYVSGRRTGKFSDYDSLLTYYVGYGGNTNSTTRFRRYEAGARPLLPEHDLRDQPHLLQPNRTYHIKLVAANGRAEYYRDGEKLFSFIDPHPLTHGWFGLRTVRSHIVIANLKIESSAR